MKKYFLINVDTEAHRGNDPVNDLIYGHVCGGVYGIHKIMDICENYHVKATFFVDFAEVNTWGFDKIKKICDDIMSRGHDIQLHIHPEHFGNWDRQEFSQYSYDEQKAMIQYGIDQYVKILGKAPIAFRAGKYSIDSTTLDVLNDFNIPIDTSFVKNNNWCKFNKDASVINGSFMYKNVQELPVTVFKERIFNKPIADKYYVFDVNTLTKFEFRDLYKQYYQSSLNAIILFMHSFSFLKRYDDDLNLKPNLSDIGFFEYILKYVTERNDFSIKTVSEYYEATKNTPIIETNFTPMIKSITKSAIGIFNRYRKASIRSKQFRKYIYGIYAVAGVLALSMLFILFQLIH